MEDGTERGWHSEFGRLGQNEVRRSVRQKLWPEAKADAARTWLHRQDVQDWQRRAPGQSAPVGATAWERRKRWAQYIIYVVAGLLGAARLFAMMRHGL
jgi:hypothetical protein